MIPGDQSAFYKFMIDIFLEEWPSVPPLKPEQLARWFRALEFVDLVRIKKAFGEYLCDSRQGKFPPKEGQILEIIKTIPFDVRSVRCTWESCSDVGSERHGDYFYCRDHCDEMILRDDPDSIQAEVIRGLRKLTLEAKELGVRGREYFKIKNPEVFRAVERMRESERREAVRKKVVRAVQDFYDTPLSPEERKKIVAELRDVAIEGAGRVKCAESV